ncbi:MAG TPA: hypothetical protein DIT48_11955 [Actinobacteria bacterium]|nr:hypothetical protein [Actinomycetota bacterium]HCP61025.1 hypothetical protein [Actinomycetota bacterium]
MRTFGAKMAWKPGDVVVLREVWQGRTWSARPVRVISDSAEERSFYVAPRNPRIVPVGPDEVELRLPVDPWAFRRRTSSAWRILSFAWPDVAYAVLGWWDAQTEEFGGWYVNLQSPLVATDEGFDYTDHLLDVLVAVDGTWRWKDEDELSDAVALSIFSPADAEGFYEAGRDAVDRITNARPPFDQDWSNWRPDPSWTNADFPEGWSPEDPG